MYHASNSGPAPRPLDFHTPRPADSVADALGPDPFPDDGSTVPVLNTAALLTELGLSDRAIREALTESPGPGS